MFHKILVAKKFMDKGDKGGGRRGGNGKVFCRIFVVSQCQKSRRGTLLCFTKFLVAKKFMEKGEGEEVKVKIFRRTVFVSQCRKNCKGTLLCFKNILVSKNVMDKRGGGYHVFCRRGFVSQYRIIS